MAQSGTSSNAVDVNQLELALSNAHHSKSPNQIKKMIGQGNHQGENQIPEARPSFPEAGSGRDTTFSRDSYGQGGERTGSVNKGVPESFAIGSTRLDGSDMDYGLDSRAIQELTRDSDHELQEAVEAARSISVASIVICGAFCLMAGYFAAISESVSILGLAIESLLDAISSAFVLWRFKKPKVRTAGGALSPENSPTNTNPDGANSGEMANVVASSEANLSREDRENLRLKRRALERERKSGIGIGIIFLMASGWLTYMAFWKLSYFSAKKDSHSLADRNAFAEENAEESTFSELIAWPSMLVFGYLGWRKINLANLLNSTVLYEDGVCSCLGSFMSFMVIIAGLLERGSIEGAWKADPITGIFIAVVLLVEGLRTLKGACFDHGEGDGSHVRMD